MPHDFQQLRARRRRLTRKPHIHRFGYSEIDARFGGAKQSDVAFVDLLPMAGAAASVLPMTNPTDGAGYVSAGYLPLFSPGGPNIHDVLQGQVADCYALACWAGMALLRPDTLIAQVVRAAASIRTRWSSGSADTWLEQDLLLPNNASRFLENAWVAFYEKAYAYWRTRANTYASLNFGNPIAPFGSLGWSTVGYYPSSSAWSAAARAIDASLPVAVLTVAKVSDAPLIGLHAYALVSVNPNNTLSLYNPWGVDGAGDGSNPDDGVVTITLAQASANLSYVVCTTGYRPPVLPQTSIPEEITMPPTLEFLKPVSGGSIVVNKSDPNHLVVTGRPVLDAIPLHIASDADSVIQSCPGSADIVLPLTAGKSNDGWLSTIPSAAKLFTFTATKGAEKTVRTIELRPIAAPTPRTPAKSPRIVVYDDFSTGPYVPNL